MQKVNAATIIVIEILETTTYENYNKSRHNYIVFKSPYGLLEVYKYSSLSN